MAPAKGNSATGSALVAAPSVRPAPGGMQPVYTVRSSMPIAVKGPCVGTGGPMCRAVVAWPRIAVNARSFSVALSPGRQMQPHVLVPVAPAPVPMQRAAPQVEQMEFQSDAAEYAAEPQEAWPPRQAPPGQEDAPRDKDNAFMKLLDSLEVRVDLMAQMQHARSQIQEQGWEGQEAPALQEPEEACQGDAGYSCQQSAPEPPRGQQDGAELWDHLLEQRECIERLQSEHEEFGRQIARARAHETDAILHVQELQRELAEERRQRASEAQEWRMEREQLQAELQDLRRLAALAAGSAAHGAPAPGGAEAAVPTEAVLPAAQQGWWVQPFSREICGANMTLSEDGYVATRTRGSRQSVSMGSSPLVRQADGWYFEVEVCETVEGWVGGLGIGVTLTPPSELRRVPDKAWRMPRTFVVGYWGCVFLDGKEHRTRWRPDALALGARVGVLVHDFTGDLHVLVDGAAVVFVEGALREHLVAGVELYPVVDVFAATVSVALLPLASAPPVPPPLCDNGAAETASPRSLADSMFSSLRNFPR